ncbi:DUF1254 domain-containing protein [Parasphingorhabdus sp. DH2-15]|uniref:DUF1254 domain-containing protein n=1 Tax=Parasphingorhabdus sp. DH2-15 TaxID=3444112 RepID=UPI003F684C89
MSKAGIISIVLAIIAAIIGYFGVMALAPGYIMGRAWDGVTERAGAPNMMIHMPLPSAARRGIVRLSPDLIYSICTFDLSKGDLAITVPAIDNHYWSLTMFDDQTNAFFVESDRDTKGQPISLTLSNKGTAGEGRIVAAPSQKGIALVRILMNNRGEYDALDPLRRSADCKIVG